MYNGQKKLKPEARRAQIIQAAIQYSRKYGFQNLERKHIAKFCDITPALVSHYLGSDADIKLTVMRVAVEQGVIEIITYGVVTSHGCVGGLTPEIKGQVIKYVNARLDDAWQHAGVRGA